MTHPNLDALVAVIRDVRPDWSAPAIRAALLDPAVRVHAYPDVIAAAVALARDPESKYPGRLGHRGPWWPSVSARTPTPPPYLPDRAKDPVATERGAALARAELAAARQRA